MKKIPVYLTACLTWLILSSGINNNTSNGFVTGTPEIKSINSLTFGPDGILFIGDSKSAAIYAVATGDNKSNKKATAGEVKNIDQKIAAALGTDVKNITITDMAVNPISKKVYLAVHSADGTPALLTVKEDKLEAFPLKDVKFSSAWVNNAPAEDAKDHRGRSLRVSTISDMAFADGKLMVSGLSNHRFASSLRSIAFPFTNQQDDATLEIYHAAHGKYETSAPIRTFTTARINDKNYIVASYTCTPLVLFPMDELKAGTHVKGRTVAEMGSGNTPIDMLSISNGKDNYLVMANTSRAISKVDYKNIAAFEGMLTEPVRGTAGVSYTAQPQMTQVMQLDKLSDNKVVLIQKKANGDIDLWTANDTDL